MQIPTTARTYSDLMPRSVPIWSHAGKAPDRWYLVALWLDGGQAVAT